MQISAFSVARSLHAFQAAFRVIRIVHLSESKTPFDGHIKIQFIINLPTLFPILPATYERPPFNFTRQNATVQGRRTAKDGADDPHVTAGLPV
jgi:hypothetical protein